MPETVRFVSERNRLTIRTEYLPACDVNALALSSHTRGLATDQLHEAAARIAGQDLPRRGLKTQ